jgi:hypothetical protein
MKNVGTTLRWLVGVTLLIGVALWTPDGALAEETSAFDGIWTVAFYCPTYNAADDHAKGYRKQFVAEVKDGVLRGGEGGEGEPGSFVLSGPIGRDGSAMLRLSGIVGSEAHAINQAPRGKPFAYRVKAQFEQAKGKGERQGKRKCDFEFTRRSS